MVWLQVAVFRLPLVTCMTFAAETLGIPVTLYGLQNSLPQMPADLLQSRPDDGAESRQCIEASAFGSRRLDRCAVHCFRTNSGLPPRIATLAMADTKMDEVFCISFRQSHYRSSTIIKSYIAHSTYTISLQTTGTLSVCYVPCYPRRLSLGIRSCVR